MTPLLADSRQPTADSRQPMAGRLAIAIAMAMAVGCRPGGGGRWRPRGARRPGTW
ncbi:hypothetical protein [Streptomyces sp. NBC_00310]|uniref:hypothetical protein n=1 Tax=Streptomyces sp. NBC_00310 TaxID=2903645 RepID=UPI002E214212